MTPIQKNKRVVDESGRECKATYSRRAKGLVKNGRARFVDENCICLVRPPNDDLEDENMSIKENTDIKGNADVKESITLQGILERIDKIQSDKAYMQGVIEAIKEIPPAPGPNDITGAGKAEALSDVVKCRETTNQKLLALYEKMYDDLKQK